MLNMLSTDRTRQTARAAAPRAFSSRPLTEDTRAELQRLFKAYDAACLELDAEAVAAIYDLPCLISTASGSTAFSARGELRQALLGRFAGYRQHGIVSASLTALELESVAADFATARVVWTLADRRDQAMVSVPRRYTLRRSDTSAGRPWKIAHVVNLADPASRLAESGRALLRLAGA
jgi:ketosteroid isomerase-like protein